MATASLSNSISPFGSHVEELEPFLDTEAPTMRTERYERAGLEPGEAELVSKATRELISVTDTAGDLDAIETTLARHVTPSGTGRVYKIDHAAELKYIAELLVELQDTTVDSIRRAIEQARIALDESQIERDDLPLNVQNKLSELQEKVRRILLNCAPRNHDVKEKKNGNDFYLALTDNGIEVYAVPLQSLEYIRHRIVALFRIPSENHPLFENGEQFRSSVVADTAHLAPEHLELIWRKGEHDDEELLEHIPDSDDNAVVGFIDTFNNRRVRLRDANAFWDQVQQNKYKDGTVLLQVGKTQVRCNVTENLASSPGGEFCVYINPADLENGDTSGYLELNRRLDDGEPIANTSVDGNTQNATSYLKNDDRSIGVPVSVVPVTRVREIGHSIWKRCRRFIPNLPSSS